jgi:hypothetical protein
MALSGWFNRPVFYDVTIKGGIVLSRLPLPMLTAVLCPAFATQAQAPQQDFPEGPGRETFVAVCGGNANCRIGICTYPSAGNG